MEYRKCLQICIVSMFLLSLANPLIYAKAPVKDDAGRRNIPVMKQNFHKPDVNLPEKAKAKFKNGEEPAEPLENEQEAPEAEPQRAPRGLIKNGKEYRGNGAEHGNKNGWGEVPVAAEPEADESPDPEPEPEEEVPETDAPEAQ